MSKNKTKDESSGDQKYIISAPLVVKYFRKKNGELTDRKELYIRRSIQDYFIKLCESKVSFEDLESYLPETEEEIKVVKLEVEFREGNWDSCDEDEESQSRVGEYVVVHQIINE